jgi:subtilase family serine protease
MTSLRALVALTAVAVASGFALQGARSRVDHGAAQSNKGTSARERDIGRLSAGSNIDFTLVLHLPHEHALNSFLMRVADPGSPLYRHYLRPSEFVSRFSPTRGVIDSIIKTLGNWGLQVRDVNPERTAIDIRGTAGLVGRIFGVSFRRYVDQQGRGYHAALGRPKVPAKLQGSVDAVAGLSNRPIGHRLDIPSAGGLTPADAAAAYDVTPLWKIGVQGQGERVAVVSLATFDPRDIKSFDRETRITGPTIKRRAVLGGTNDATSGNAREVALDLETIRGIAPKAQIIDYELPEPSSDGQSYQGPFAVSIAKAVDTISKERRADIVSISYGACDVTTAFDGNPWLPEADRLLGERAFQFAASLGINVFVASGDTGAYDCQFNFLGDHRIVTDWPSDSPWVTAVGGTLLSVRNDGSYLDETGWANVLENGGGGGGLAPHTVRPDWQTGPGVVNSASNGNRQTPDVSADADPHSGFHVVQGGQDSSSPVGGTSASTPFWAGSTALLDQLARRNGISKVGNLNPPLYQLAATNQPFPPFHDITRGSNRYFRATPGWDYATGLGSPDVLNLARDVVAYLNGRTGG